MTDDPMTDGLDTLRLGARPEGPTALTADWVLAWRNGGHCLLRGAEVVIDGARIINVVPAGRGEAMRRIDFGHALISPGFIDLDALSDLDTTILGVDNHPAWAKGRVWPESYVQRGPYEMYSPEELAFQKRFAFAELLRNGITTAAPIASLFYREWGEKVAEFDAAAEAAAELGLRVYLGPAYRAGGMVLTAPGRMEPRFDAARGMDGLADAVRFVETHDMTHGGLIRGLLAPDRVETCTAALLQRTMTEAERLDCPIRLHCAQGAMEVDTVQALHGTTAPRWLAELGVLSPRLLAPHATRADAGDLALYAEHGVHIVHCPLVSARGGGTLDVRAARAQGINVAMGTDTAPPDMLLNLAVGQMVGRIVTGDPSALSAAEMFDLATTSGARALGRSDLGRLEPGACADIAVFDLDQGITPTIDPVQSLVLGASGRVTRAVFVDGRLSMRDGAVAGLDDTARAQAQGQFDRLVARYPDRTWDHPPVTDIFPPSFPMEDLRDA